MPLHYIHVHKYTTIVIHLIPIQFFILCLFLSPLQIACQRGLFLSQCDSACFTSLQSRSGQGRPFSFPFVLLQRHNILRKSLVPTSLCTLIIVGWHILLGPVFSVGSTRLCISVSGDRALTYQAQATAFPWFARVYIIYFILVSSVLFSCLCHPCSVFCSRCYAHCHTCAYMYLFNMYNMRFKYTVLIFSIGNKQHNVYSCSNNTTYNLL